MYLPVLEGLGRKTVFVAGPRQSGKTTLAKSLPGAAGAYPSLGWSIVASDGPRFENLVAAHLLKWVQYQQDVYGKDLELPYFRDTDGREVDFVVTDRQSLLLLGECKWADTEVGRSLR